MVTDDRTLQRTGTILCWTTGIVDILLVLWLVINTAYPLYWPFYVGWSAASALLVAVPLMGVLGLILLSRTPARATKAMGWTSIGVSALLWSLLLLAWTSDPNSGNL